ncbi:MAG: hypothetical protein R6U96_10765, partial [Promethearchaeia archaeon]
EIPSPSGMEDNIREHLTNHLSKKGIQHKTDRKGNIYSLSNPGAPLLSAHMDTKPFLTEKGNMYPITISDGKISGTDIIGGDDKCGIYLILEMLKHRPQDINFLISVEEEDSRKGVKAFMKDHGDEVAQLPYALVLDRHGSRDILCTQNRYGVLAFESRLAQIGKQFGYSPARGLLSDADILCYQISCANLSVGYYNAHDTDEYIILDDLKNAYFYVNEILDHIHQRFPAARTYRP